MGAPTAVLPTKSDLKEPSLSLDVIANQKIVDNIADIKET